MPLCITTAVVFCIVVNCVHVESQVPLPLPTLTLSPAVNASQIVMFSQVELICTIPDKAPFPVSVFISHADNPVEDPAPWANFQNLQRPDTITFTILVNPEMEGALVCWYKSTRTKETSGLSNSVDIVINTVPNPLMSLIPSPIFPVGGTYIVQCEIPSDDLRNVTLSLYMRQLPLSPGNKNFSFIGSRVLLPGEWGASINRTNVVQSVEYACKMEVFYKGKVFLSSSSPVAAIPEELPARLYSSANESPSCAGYLSLKVKEVWRPICFQSRYIDTEEHLANIVCREVKCGYALTWNKHMDINLNFFGTPRCTGTENRIAECPILNPKDCERRSLYVICSGAFHPPKLSVIGRGSGPWVYISPEEPVRLRCALESRMTEINDIGMFLTITNNGMEFATSRSDNTGNVWSMGYEITPRVQEGEFVCFARVSSNIVKTENSNSIHIYIYDPPPAGAVAAAVITSIAGAAIIFYICVFRTS